MSSLYPFFYICSWLINKHLKNLLTISSACCFLQPTFLKINRAFYIFALKSVYFWNISKIIQNILKIFFNCNSSVYFENIIVCNEPFRSATLLKKRPWPRCFPVNFTKFLRPLFFSEDLWWILLSFLDNFCILVWCTF